MAGAGRPSIRGSIPGKERNRGGLAQSVECVVRNDEAPGSKPGFSTFARGGAGASCDMPLQPRKSHVVLL